MKLEEQKKVYAGLTNGPWEMRVSSHAGYVKACGPFHKEDIEDKKAYDDANGIALMRNKIDAYVELAEMLVSVRKNNQLPHTYYNSNAGMLHDGSCLACKIDDAIEKLEATK